MVGPTGPTQNPFARWIRLHWSAFDSLNDLAREGGSDGGSRTDVGRGKTNYTVWCDGMSGFDRMESNRRAVARTAARLKEEGFTADPHSGKVGDPIHVTGPKEAWITVRGDQQGQAFFLSQNLPSNRPVNSFVVFVDQRQAAMPQFFVVTAVEHQAIVGDDGSGWVEIYRSDLDRLHAHNAWGKLR